MGTVYQCLQKTKRWNLKLNNMLNYLNKKQTIIASGFIYQGEKILVVRSTGMLEQLNDTEYYDIPSWGVPFGVDPQKKVEESIKKLLDSDDFNVLDPIGTYSFVHNDGSSHTIGIVYSVTTPKTVYDSLEECENIQFIDIKDMDSYIFSDRIKNIIKNNIK